MKRQSQLHKIKIPAHRDYTLTFVRNNGKREPCYLPYVFTSEEKAQAWADSRNAHYKHGKLVVEFKDYPESIGYKGTLRLA